MEQDPQIARQALPLPSRPERRQNRQAGPERDGGLRKLRHLSNWTLAAAIVGVGATSAALAHAIPAPTAVTAPARANGTTAASGVGNAPNVSNPVATTSASGVTVSPAAAPAAPAGATARYVATSGGS